MSFGGYPCKLTKRVLASTFPVLLLSTSDKGASSSSTTKPAPAAQSTPKTGDSLMMVEFCIVAIAISAGIAVIAKRRIR